MGRCQHYFYPFRSLPFHHMCPEPREPEHCESRLNDHQHLLVTDYGWNYCSGFVPELPAISLMKSYVSVASPDRKEIINNALTSLGKMNKLPKAKAISLLDILLGKRIMSTDHELSYAEFKDSSGEIVATFSNGTWHAMGTPAEDARTSEFYGIYRDAWNAAKSETANTPVPTAANSIDITT